MSKDIKKGLKSKLAELNQKLFLAPRSKSFLKREKSRLFQN